MKFKGIFVTGTDTGVGKTYISCLIAKELKKHNIDTGVMKPVETGCAKRGGILVPSDGLLLKSSASTIDPLELIVPYRFRAPLAPLVAGKIERKKIELKKIFDSLRILSKKHDFLLVEGAGGLLVPLTQSYTYLDFIIDTGLEVVLVAGNKLGVINHTMLTIECLKKHGINPVAIVLNNFSPKNTPAKKTNFSALKSLIGSIPLFNVTYRTKRVNYSLIKLLLQSVIE